MKPSQPDDFVHFSSLAFSPGGHHMGHHRGQKGGKKDKCSQVLMSLINIMDLMVWFKEREIAPTLPQKQGLRKFKFKKKSEQKLNFFVGPWSTIPVRCTGPAIVSL